MKTNLNNIWQKCTWQNLQQIYMQQMWDLSVERRYFKFQNEIQFSSNSIMKQLNHRNSDSFCDHNMSCFYQLLHHSTSMTGLCWCHGVILFFYPFSLTYLVRWAPSVRAPEISLACAALHGSRWRFHVNMGFSDDDRILAVTSNICCNIATGTCLI